MTQQLRNGDISPDHVDLRDTFAAAALTGYLANESKDDPMTIEDAAEDAYRYAGSMLRERAKTNHDAVPEAKDRTAGELGGARVTGNTQEPVAWAVRYKPRDTGVVALCRTLAECRDQWSNRATDHWRYVPLYSHPHSILTAEEREAIETAVRWLEPYPQVASTLRNLLERLHT
jgi:hypothetical protein